MSLSNSRTVSENLKIFQNPESINI